MKILFVGDASPGSLSAYRAKAMGRASDVMMRTIALHTPDPRPVPGLLQSVAWRLRVPIDVHRVNRRVREAAREFAPDVLFLESATLLRRSTLAEIARNGALIVGMSQDYVTAPHNTNIWQNACFGLYDLFFTTKTYGVEELQAAGVRDVRLVNNTYEAAVHHPLDREQVGDQYEAFDCVFIGTYEQDRGGSIRKLAEAGMSVLVHGNAAGRLAGGWDEVAHPNITLRPAANHENYTQAMHHGKIALAFLRKINRDQITCRSMEIPAMRRPMLAERTEEHDAQFTDGVEYMAFSGDDELIERARLLLENDDLRDSIARDGMARCQSDKLDNEHQVAYFLQVLREKIGERDRTERRTT